MKGFTIVELVIVLALFAVIAAVLIPTFVNFFNSEKANIVDIANGDVETINVDRDGNTLEDVEGYTLIDVNIRDSIVYCVYEKTQND